VHMLCGVRSAFEGKEYVPAGKAACGIAVNIVKRQYFRVKVNLGRRDCAILILNPGFKVPFLCFTMISQL
jgi:hypothetical protein